MHSPFRITNKSGLRSQPAVKTQKTANKYMARQIALGSEKSAERAASLHKGASDIAKSELAHDAAAKASLKASTASHKYANQYKTNPAKPHNPQNAGSKSQFAVEETKPKKYKKAKDYQQMMGLNATYGKNSTPGTDTQTMTNHPYESVRYNIPFDRDGAEDNPIGLDKDLEAKDNKDQLKRRKAMKLVKARVDETFGGTGLPGLGMGEKSVGDLTSAEPEKNYKPTKKTFKKLKESLVSEMGFVGADGATDASPNQDEINIGSNGQSLTIDSDISNEKRKVKKKSVKEELSVPEGTTGKRKKVFSAMVPIRMADGSIRSLPPGKSGSSGH
jgi:hypothetical protein